MTGHFSHRPKRYSARPFVPEPETVALDLKCAECGRSPRAGETWRILFADRVAREAVICCPECAEREFSDLASD
jgi:hypothetical protein